MTTKMSNAALPALQMLSVTLVFCAWSGEDRLTRNSRRVAGDFKRPMVRESNTSGARKESATSYRPGSDEDRSRCECVHFCAAHSRFVLDHALSGSRPGFGPKLTGNAHTVI